MEYLGNILCITGGELILSDKNPNGVMPVGTYTALAHRGKMRVLRRACYGSPALVEYDSLPVRYREAWEARHGDPHARRKFAPFAERLREDTEAYNVFTAYTYDGGRKLPDEAIVSYCNDAMILNAVRETLEVMTAARKAARLSMAGRWEKILKLVDGIRADYPNNLPKTAITLKRKYQRYQAEGYTALIHAGFGNRNRAKVKDRVDRAVLLDILSHGNQLPATVAAETYNLWAASHRAPTITPRTVLNYMTEHAVEIDVSRRGSKAWADEFDPIVHRIRPTAPLLLVNSDDNDLDLYFKNGRDNYYRFKLYVVLDAHCDYILGYAFGDQVTNELIREAYRNAMRHIRELTGGYYLWHQTVADRWGLRSDNLLGFFESLATFTPPTAGLARAKVIERSFGTEWHNALKHYNNYAGHNITAREKHNSDFAQTNLKRRPSIAEAPALIARFIASMRTLEWKGSGRSREQVWLDGFRAMGADRAKRISEEVYLQRFGHRHEYKNTVRNSGITVTIGEIRRTYDVPETIYRQAVGRKVRITYDPADLSRVLVEGDRLRFIAPENVPLPMALADMQPGDRERLNAVLERKKRLRDQNRQSREERRALLERIGTDAQSLLQAGVMVKEARFGASEIVNRLTLNDDHVDGGSIRRKY
ncbi:Mu transposase C-terminal domain-containing protein [uncultured Rikenella sp.]|uniref:Mu transposase C-terminal domain-containing protein n=1 Tax=uncultured Rikenella sp. TaxID=368003 RepID=UPI0025D2EEC3|nr:Mu transposase C-terminal domain-containing protein [uncultured Rikenella sp.]